MADASIQNGSLVHLQGDGTVIRSMLGVPLILNERVIGVLGVLNRRRGRDFTQDDRQLLEVIAWKRSACGKCSGGGWAAR